MPTTTNRKPEVSVVTSCFNEQGGILEFLSILKITLDNLGFAYEVIVIDDGSTDDTVNEICTFKWEQLRLVGFRRNHGHQSALQLGLGIADGDLVITLDSDLQHPPQLIEKLIEVHKQTGCDVVQTIPKSRKSDSKFKRNTAKIYYSVIRKITDVEIMTNSSDYRLITRSVVNDIKGKSNKVLRLLIPSLGYSTQKIEYELGKRYFGKSKYTLRKMITLALDSIVNFTNKPLYWVMYIGIFVSLSAILCLGFVVVSAFNHKALAGWPSLASFILFLGGVQLISIGIIGIYFGKFIEAQSMSKELMSYKVYLK